MIYKEIEKLIKKKEETSAFLKSETLDNRVSKAGILNLRNLRLDHNDIQAIANIIELNNNRFQIKSISFSYNKLIGDEGATLLAEKLPKSIYELGLVDCGIGDKGGIAILHWMRKSETLQMVCIEQNNFSDKLKSAFNQFKKNNPKVMFVY